MSLIAKPRGDIPMTLPYWTDLTPSWVSAPLRLALESRAGLELGALLATQPLLRLAPHGDGHPLLVFPLLLGSDISTLPLRSFLSDLGYAVAPWTLGINLGPRAGVMTAARARLDDLYHRHGRKVSLIGWSVGGLYARELAKQAPERVRMVITLGTPLTGTPRPAELWRLVQQATGREYGLPETTSPLEEAPPVPTTSIFSPSDGIVAWQDSVQPEEPMAENIGVESSHLGLGVNALVLYAIADRLAQREGQWQPFHRQGWRAMLYRNPHHEGRARSRV